MKAPNFTRENAADMARRATRSRLARIAREKAEKEALATALASTPVHDDARKARTLRQIDSLDVLIDEALVSKNRAAFIELTGVKERLWKLVNPSVPASKVSDKASTRRPILGPVGPA